jgi:hypothetical protein
MKNVFNPDKAFIFLRRCHLDMLFSKSTQLVKPLCIFSPNSLALVFQAAGSAGAKLNLHKAFVHSKSFLRWQIHTLRISPAFSVMTFRAFRAQQHPGPSDTERERALLSRRRKRFCTQLPSRGNLAFTV